MKTLFHSLLAVAFILPGFTAKASTTPASHGLGPKITICIELGRKSKNCEYRGLCRISTSISPDYQSGSNIENTATGTAWMENGRLKIEFDRASMSDATYQTHFGDGKFKLEENYTLPAEVSSALGVRLYTIKTGTYTLPPSTSESGALSVTF